MPFLTTDGDFGMASHPARILFKSGITAEKKKEFEKPSMPFCDTCNDLESKLQEDLLEYSCTISELENASRRGCKACQCIFNSCVCLARAPFGPNDEITLSFQFNPRSQKNQFKIFGVLGPVLVYADTSCGFLLTTNTMNLLLRNDQGEIRN